MKTLPALALCLIAGLSLPCFAQPAAEPAQAAQPAQPGQPAQPAAAAAAAQPAPAAEATQAAPGRSGEPVVQHTVIDDGGTRIDELKVRGETQRITVTPKVGPAQGYEIIPAGGARNMSDGASSTRGAAGKRVWHVLSF